MASAREYMKKSLEATDLDLSDAELIEVLKNHGLSRRQLMAVLGLGAGVTAFSGTTSARTGQQNRIDDVFGASYAKDDTVPRGLVDHVVELHVHGVDEDGAHEGFPVPDDARDADPMTPGFQPDSNDADDVPEFHFDPVGLHVTPGDVVEFRNVSFEHTVTAFHPKFSNPELQFPMRVPDGVPGFTSPPYVGDESWLYRFTIKGVYDLFCFPHIAFGMVMRILVFDPAEDDLDDDSFDEYGNFTHPAFANNDRVLSDDRLDPGTIANEGDIAWDSLSLSGPAAVPRPKVESLSLSEVGTGSDDAVFDADWTVSDPNGDLDTVLLTLADLDDGETEDMDCGVISGASKTCSTQLEAKDEDGEGHEYQVELTVTDATGSATTAVATATEDGTDT
jgi:plastocyanin